MHGSRSSTITSVQRPCCQKQNWKEPLYLQSPHWGWSGGSTCKESRLMSVRQWGNVVKLRAALPCSGDVYFWARRSTHKETSSLLTGPALREPSWCHQGRGLVTGRSPARETHGRRMLTQKKIKDVVPVKTWAQKCYLRTMSAIIFHMQTQRSVLSLQNIIHRH